MTEININHTKYIVDKTINSQDLKKINRMTYAHINDLTLVQQAIELDNAQDHAIEARVKEIIQAIRTQGDSALLNYSKQFDDLEVNTVADLIVPQEQLKEAFLNLDTATKKALETAHARLLDFHKRQRAISGESWEFIDHLGNQLGQRVSPIERVGVYVPGGKASYPSSVLMNVVPAKVAGVNHITMVAPAKGGVHNPLVLAAAYLAEVDEVITMGGAQAVAALAYGTESITAVDKIVGPGNAYVASAKKHVFGKVGIDMIAGPSEILIIADGSVDAKWVAMDLFSQAEHDELAQSILISWDKDYINEVIDEMIKLLPIMPRKSIIYESLMNRGLIIDVENAEQACEVTNYIAPEHLELAVQSAVQLLPKIKHAGAVFLGPYSSESLGDYCAGPNHVLPTSRTARFSSSLGVYDFQKRTSLLNISKDGALILGKTASILAKQEGLMAHAQSALLRVEHD